MDFKWTLSRPGISLEFETGSIREALGMLEEEGTQISEVFGFAVPSHQQGLAAAVEAPAAASADKPARGRPRKPAAEAVAPEPLPIPAAAEVAPPLVPTATATLPPNQLAPAPAPLDIPADLDRRAELKAPPPLPVPSAPPVGLLGPKVVEVLQAKAAASPDGGQALADWLANCGLTIKGKSFEEACRAVVMISDEKLGPAAGILGVS